MQLTHVAAVFHHGIIIEKIFEKNQCIQYEYNPCIEEKSLYFHNLGIKILFKLFSFSDWTTHNAIY